MAAQRGFGGVSDPFAKGRAGWPAAAPARRPGAGLSPSTPSRGLRPKRAYFWECVEKPTQFAVWLQELSRGAPGGPPGWPQAGGQAGPARRAGGAAADTALNERGRPGGRLGRRYRIIFFMKDGGSRRAVRFSRLNGLPLAAKRDAPDGAEDRLQRCPRWRRSRSKAGWWAVAQHRFRRGSCCPAYPVKHYDHVAADPLLRVVFAR